MGFGDAEPWNVVMRGAATGQGGSGLTMRMPFADAMAEMAAGRTMYLEHAGAVVAELDVAGTGDAIQVAAECADAQ